MRSTESHYDRDARRALLVLAVAAIDHGLAHGRPPEVDPAAYGPALRTPRATFVTLHLTGRLRGCIGTLEAFRPLVLDVAHNAFAAAFEDPRFPALRHAERDGLDLHISVLTPPEPLAFDSEAALLAQIRPGVDGLILSDRGHRGTFLPSVWESLPEPRQFLDQLKRKAGLPPGHWSPTVAVARYTTESFGSSVRELFPDDA